MAVYNQELNQEAANSTQRPHKWRKRLVILLALVLGIVAAYWLRWPTFSWNQKMTVEIEVGGQVVSGSSVSHVKVSYQPQLLPEIASITSSIQGEAVDVALPDGRHVFALLDNSLSLAPKLLTDIPHDDRSGAWTSIFSAISRKREVRELPPDLYPTFVMFGDIADPTSLTRLKPDDFSSALGGDAKLKLVKLAITDEDVTEGTIALILPWIGHLERYRTDPGNPFTNSLPPEIGYLRSK